MKQEYITTAELAAHCFIDNPDQAETKLLEDDLQTAVDTVQNKIQQPLTDILEEDGTLPAPLKSAALLIAANLYANHEPTSFGTPHRIPYSLDYLIQPYVKYR